MDEIAHHVWQTKYRYKENGYLRDETIKDTWRRVARAIAAVEPRDREWWEDKFFEILKGYKFLPGGRILAGAGTGRRVTLFNCFVMGVIEDSLSGILSALSEGTLTLQQGGGVGYDFSTLRPKGMRAKGVGAIASGPVSFMQIWDAMSEALMATGPRRAAIMGTLRCDHPDIELFIGAKREPGRLRHFNLSVQITDAFMAAVHSDTDWPLFFRQQPAAAKSSSTATGRGTPVQCRAMSCAPFLPASCGTRFCGPLTRPRSRACSLWTASTG